MNLGAFKLVAIDTGKLFRFLLEKQAPVMEGQIIKKVLRKNYDFQDYRTLYELHFSLFHALYRLKLQAGISGYLLYIDPMRIRMVKLPADGCLHYYPEKGAFCPEARVKGYYCRFHAPHEGRDSRTPVFDPLREFYLDAGNINYGEGEFLQRIMKGMKSYVFNRKDVEEALRFFDLYNPDRATLQRRYHQLAKLYHPDYRKGNDSQMKRLNVFYKILKEVFII